MPLIPIVGRKAWSVRFLIGALYAILTLGAITMVYPFTLMLVTAMTSNADWAEFRLAPRYWYNKEAQFRKYVIDKTTINYLAYEYQNENWFTESNILEDDMRAIMSKSEQAISQIAADYDEFMNELNPDFKHLSFIYRENKQYSAISLRPAYFRWLAAKYDNNLNKVNTLYDETAKQWDELGFPRGMSFRAWELNPLSTQHRDWREYVASQPPAKQALVTLDGLAFDFLRSRFGSTKALKAAYETDFNHLLDVRWNTLSEYEWGRVFQKIILRTRMPLEQIRLHENARPTFEKFARRYYPKKTPAFTTEPPMETLPRSAWIQFIRSEECLPEFYNPVDPLELWQKFLKEKYNTVDALNNAYETKYASFESVVIPFPYIDYAAFLNNHRQLMRKYVFGNFALVFDYILVHGRALINTIIFIALSIGTALTINPMAAYVLSRFRLRYAHHILVFLLATMAFPGEVIMIPNFLTIKSFPLGIILTGVGVLALYFTVNLMLKIKRIPLFWNVLLGTVVTITAMRYLPPIIAEWMGRPDLNVSLMNTFFALVLPGMAQGYSIFLLKGFFDSLPPELYEAGMLDGASEMHMFWRITLPMCKPILAVIALGAFTHAYGAFMFAFLTCQDPRMWTLMVFLYEFQQMYSVPVVMASLVISAIPTLLVFIFCQNIILRGIVIPTFK
ncbi:MAG: ABC transporter permease subunit [Lentisphaerae bacterium]|nr:ABC transporter permease subunit [Lentisphaerota bacterium]